jgi:hypothetical protein
MLVEIAAIALAKTDVTFSCICDKFGINKKTHEYTKAVFGYTIKTF